MANAFYSLGAQKILEGEIDWTTDDFKAILVDTDDYSVNLDTHEFLSDVAAGAIVKTSGNLSGKSTTLGVADCADITFTSVTGDQFEAVIFYKDSGDPATSPLLMYFDVADGLPMTPSGTNITCQISTDGLFGK